jgi:hypothetical protein
MMNSLAPLVGSVIDPAALAKHVLQHGFGVKSPGKFLMQQQPPASVPGDPNAMPPQGGEPPMQGNPGVGVDAPQANPQDILAAQQAGGMDAAGLGGPQSPMPMGGGGMQMPPEQMPMPMGGAPTGLEDVPLEVLMQMQQQMAAQQQ